MKISPSFTLEELTFSQTARRRKMDNTPSPDFIENLKRLCVVLEKVRKAVGHPIIINSAYRSYEVNSAVGGVKTSQHCIGCAADFHCKEFTPKELMRIITTAGIEFDQLILEYDSWIHISVPNKTGWAWRMQSLVIDKEGTRKYTMPAPLKGKKPKPLRKSKTMMNASLLGGVGTVIAIAPAIEPAGQVVELAQNNTQGFLLVLGLVIVAFAAVAAFIRYSDRNKL